MRAPLLFAVLAATSANAEGIALEPWSGDERIEAELEDEVRRALRRVHPRLVALTQPCDVDCARLVRADAVVSRAARGGLGEPVCVEVNLRPLGGEPRVFARCRSSVAELRAAIREELPDVLRGPLATWRAPVVDIREGEVDAGPEPDPAAPKEKSVSMSELSRAGLWTVGAGAGLVVLGTGTALALLPVLGDPQGSRGAKDFALNAGRTSLFVGISFGTATAATGALLYAIGARE